MFIKNKSLITNLLSLLLVIAGLILSEPVVLSAGLFALSGALTNWLAVYMLFEKVPGLYGSGIIPDRFEEIKKGINELIMGEFFTKENIERFFGMAESPKLVLAPVVGTIDLGQSFETLLTVVKESSFGGMIGLIGGEEVLYRLKDPFIDKLRESIMDMVQSESFQEEIDALLKDSSGKDKMIAGIETIVKQRLDELTPSMVKEITRKMISAHLGWLVVWGGIFGGLIGFLTSFLQMTIF